MQINRGSFIILESVESTNNYAMEQVHAGSANDGDAWFAIEQTNGKGRRGRVWMANKGENIILSIAVHTRFLRIYEQFQLSAAVSLACYDLFKSYDSIHTKVKWPNDLYWQDRKLGGILIENIVGAPRAPAGPGLPSNWDWAVTGIGLNINQTSFPPELPNPVSLKQITGKTFDTVLLAKNLCGDINDGFSQLLRNGFDEIYKLYNENIYKRGATVKLKKNSAVFQTTIKAVSETGELVTHNGVFEERFAFGEISWLL